MISATICAVAVLTAVSTAALADRNYIVQLLGYSNEQQCGKIFDRAAGYKLLTVKRCGHVQASCRRHVKATDNANIAEARTRMAKAIRLVPGAGGVTATVKSGSTC